MPSIADSMYQLGRFLAGGGRKAYQDAYDSEYGKLAQAGYYKAKTESELDKLRRERKQWQMSQKAIENMPAVFSGLSPGTATVAKGWMQDNPVFAGPQPRQVNDDALRGLQLGTRLQNLTRAGGGNAAQLADAMVKLATEAMRSQAVYHPDTLPNYAAAMSLLGADPTEAGVGPLGQAQVNAENALASLRQHQAGAADALAAQRGNPWMANSGVFFNTETGDAVVPQPFTANKLGILDTTSGDLKLPPWITPTVPQNGGAIPPGAMSLDPTTSLRKYQEMLALGVPQDVARGVAYGTYKVARDMLGNVTVVDLASGKPVLTMSDKGVSTPPEAFRPDPKQEQALNDARRALQIHPDKLDVILERLRSIGIPENVARVLLGGR